jgi:hypothetical protein
MDCQGAGICQQTQPKSQEVVSTIKKRDLYKKCPHGRRERVCKQCGGNGICEHNHYKARCSDCGGSAICKHKKRKSTCRDCGGSEICEHKKLKSKCHDCGGSEICEHKKQKSRCRDCGGSQICEHNKRKSTCRDCGGSQICEHKKRKSVCHDCGGSAFCEHKKQKSRCQDCGGSSICEHNKLKSKCRDCGGSDLCKYCKGGPDARQGQTKYDGYCATCFKRLWPGDPRSKLIYKHLWELKVRVFLDTQFADFVHDMPLHTAHCDCSHRRRVDHRRIVGNTLLCVETDEWWHRYYKKDDEQARYHDVIMAWGGKLCFVRFNPNGDGPPLEERLERLRAVVTVHIGRLERGENSAYLEVWHLYYPEGTDDYYEEARAVEGFVERVHCIREHGICEHGICEHGIGGHCRQRSGCRHCKLDWLGVSMI